MEFHETFELYSVTESAKQMKLPTFGKTCDELDLGFKQESRRSLQTKTFPIIVYLTTRTPIAQ
jgi:hypothetical protein